MSTIPSSRTRSAQTQNAVVNWLDRNKSKFSKWTLIAIVAGYVAFLIVTPIAALTWGAFERGIEASISSLNHPEVLTAFWNTLWISVVVVIIHTIFGTVVAEGGEDFASRAAT